MDDRAVLERASSPGRAFAIQSLISVSIGLFVVFLFSLVEPLFNKPVNFLIGGLIGLIIHACSILGQLLVFRLLRPRAKLAILAARYVPFFVGGALGWLSVKPVVLVLGLPGGFEWAQQGWTPIVGFGMLSIGIGASHELTETLKERLRQSVERIVEQEFAERELIAARSLQKRLLPPEETEGPGYRIAARTVPAVVVAGDFYDVFRLSSGRVGFAIGDVAGKGMAASLIMASVKAMLPLIAAEHGVAATLVEINRLLRRDLGPREFVALCYGCFDPASRELHLANAALPDPYRIGRGDAGVEVLTVPGPRLPLGIRDDVEYQELAVSLSAGEQICLLTDGLPEARDRQGEPVGYDAVEKLLLESPRPPLGRIEHLFNTVRSRTSESPEDDWTALVLEVLGPIR